MCANIHKLVSAIPILAVAVLCAQQQPSSNGFPKESKPFTLRLTKIVCPNYPTEYTRLHECRIQLARNTVPVLIERGTVFKPIESAWLRVTLYYRFSGSYRPLLIDLEFDACKLFQSISNADKNDDKFAAFMYRGIIDYIPWKGPCPWPAAELNVKNFTIKEEQIPSILPAGDYRVVARLFDAKNVTIMENHLYFAVRAKGLVDLSMG